MDSRDAKARDARMKACQLPTTSDGGKSFTVRVRELVSVAAQIARMDEMLAQAEASLPAGVEARRWHQISVQALTWKREALTAQQKNILSELKTLTPGARAVLPEPTDAESAVCHARNDGEPEAELSPEAQTCEPEAPPSP